ncbi:MAG: AmmeMemoRadiSam system protein B [Bacteroidales bacterium]
MSSSKQIRPAAVAGAFYPGEESTLTNQLKIFFNSFREQKIVDNVAAVIVPHAGYVFSGRVAASAFARINPEKEYDHIFLIGPSHYVCMDGASVNNEYGFYQTPLGKVKVDTELCDKLITDYPFFACRHDAHLKEHCLEIQLPFIQYHFKHEISIVPIIIGTQSADMIRKIANALEPYFNGKNLFVISSDFSHYPTYKGAEESDKRTGDAIETGSPDKFIQALQQNSDAEILGLETSACGQCAILTLLYLSSDAKNISIHHIMYENSGDSEYGEKDHVVGYHSFLFTRNQSGPEKMTFSLSDNEKGELLKIARESINSKLENKELLDNSSYNLTKTLMMPCGAFVTLNKSARLRGCIGLFVVHHPLYEIIREMAVAAAFEDPRFPNVEESEMENISIEISVLSPLKKINNIDEFSLGKQGIYIKKGMFSGTFLPQVAKDTGWTKEEFLGHCSHDKAGLSWDGWKDADLYTYEAIVFSE